MAIFVRFFSLKVYPSLESDEEDHANKAKLKRKKNWDDTPWSPKGKWLKCCTYKHLVFRHIVASKTYNITLIYLQLG